MIDLPNCLYRFTQLSIIKRPSQSIMAVYDKPVWQLLIDFADQVVTMEGRTFTSLEATNWFRSNYPEIKKATINAHIRMMSTNVQSRLNWSPRSHHNVFFALGTGMYRRYDPNHDPPPIMPGTESVPSTGTSTSSQSVIYTTKEEEDLTPGEGTEFAYERDLQNYLVKNLHQIEPGLTLYNEDGITGVEYPVGGRRIDILATDSDDSLVVIELKVSKGHDRVIGQILRYLGWIKANLADEEQKVRGIIIAKDISEDLRLACSMTNDISLREYSISFSLDEIQI